MTINPYSLPAPYQEQAIQGNLNSGQTAMNRGSITDYTTEQLAEIMNPEDYASWRLNVDAQREDTAKAWEREDTTYQRLVKDLKEAGLNPWLAFNSLGGSSNTASPSYSASSNASANATKQTKTSSKNQMVQSVLALVGTALMALALM